jgi:penicillin-binding protein 2
MPSTRWKLRTFRQKWYAGETISVAIGQGAVTISPLELAAALGGVSIGGRWYRPHLLRDAKPVLTRDGHLNPRNVTEVIDGLYGVVNEGGTGHAAALPNIAVCGKTGTAQLVSTEKMKALHLKNNAWFEAFAPRDAPEIAVVALFESGEEGANAAWIVRDVMKAYFDKKARMTKERTQLTREFHILPVPWAAPAALALGGRLN